MLMAIKTTTNGYHVYKYGKHKHKNGHPAAFRGSVILCEFMLNYPPLQIKNFSPPDGG
jgi:hypothetical protein